MPAARRRYRHGVPGADDGTQPGQDDRRTGGRRHTLAHRRQPGRRRGLGAPDPRPGRPAGGAVSAVALSAPAFRRPAPARGDRDRLRAEAKTADRRRTHHRARRGAAGADPRPSARPGGGKPHGAASDQPRFGGRHRHGRPGDHHAPRHGDGGRRDRADARRPGPPLYAPARRGVDARAGPAAPRRGGCVRAQPAGGRHGGARLCRAATLAVFAPGPVPRRRQRLVRAQARPVRGAGRPLGLREIDAGADDPGPRPAARQPPTSATTASPRGFIPVSC